MSLDAEERELRVRQLDQDLTLRRREQRLRRMEYEFKKLESRRNAWLLNPISVAIIAGAIALYGHYQVHSRNELAQREFCFRIIQELATKDNETLTKQRPVLTELSKVLKRTDEEGCESQLGSSIDLLTSPKDAVAAGAGTAVRSSAPAAIATSGECKQIKSLIDLGWRSGHKTNFCRSRQYDGVYNPFGVYGAGGFCYQGAEAACIAQIEAAVRPK
jgi:hypothetical protein